MRNAAEGVFSTMYHIKTVSFCFAVNLHARKVISVLR